MTFLFPPVVYTIHTKLLFSRYKNSTDGSVCGVPRNSPSYSYSKF